MKRVLSLVFLLVLVGACTETQPAPPQSSAVTKETEGDRIEKKAKSDLELEIERLNEKRALEVSVNVKKFRVNEKLDSLGLSGPLATGLGYAVSEPKTYSEMWFLKGYHFESFEETDIARDRMWRAHMRVMVAYGLLQTGNSPIGLTQIKGRVMETWKNPAKKRLAYSLATPSAKLALGMMGAMDKEKYLFILKHTRDYISKFNFQMEDRYLMSLTEYGNDSCLRSDWRKNFYNPPEGRFLRCEDLFTRFGPDGLESPFRKAEAFVFRRVKNDEWRIRDMESFITQLISDLS